MIRPAFTEVGLFLIPFAAYALFLVAARAGLLAPASWPLPVVARLAAVALVFVLVGFALLAHFSGAPANSVYVPAHIDNGKFVPGAQQ
jgi:hypothetical protein